MKYELIKGSLNDINNPKKTIMLNRGIEKWKQYLNLNESCVYDSCLLSNIDKAVDCFLRNIDNKSRIHIIVDPDVDGFTSASMVYKYIKSLNKDIQITYSLHTRKEHGLADDIELPHFSEFDLLIIPDAGSNDSKQCQKLSEQGVDIIILDHHECDVENNYAIIVNNQLCNYPNKNLCGAGIVFKFLQKVDEELWENHSTSMLDLMALANISDNMDIREPETRYYIDKGLKNINNKLFKALIEKQAYSMNNTVNINSVQFYVTPILNALIRIGSQEEKDLLFRAFIETDEIFKYKKRGETEEIDEDIYTRAARLCYNAKSRQAKEVQKGVDSLDEMINKNNLNDNKVLFANVTDIIGQSLTGLVAIKIADKYGKPCVLLRRQAPRKDGSLFYGGSCRNIDCSPIPDLKQFLTSTGQFEFVQGHPNAAGVSIARENVKNAILTCNEFLKHKEFSKILMVDFEIFANEMTVSFIKEIDEMKDIFGHGIREPLVCIKDIPVYIEDVTLMGKNMNTWKIIDYEGFAFVKFNADKESDALLKKYNQLAMEMDDGIIGEINVVGKVNINNYKGILTPQIIIEDYEFKECA